jgi:Cu/Ag efflux protein CusF
MKINILSSALAAILGLALIGTTVNAQSTNAAPATSTATSATKEKGDFTPYKGKVSAVDASSVTVTTASGDLKLVVDDTTKVQIAKKKAAITDFAVGDAVTGSYTKNADGTLTAHSLRKKAAK